MGRSDLRSDSREESRGIVDHELYRHDFIHLHSLPLPKIRRSTVPHGHVCQRGFRHGCYRSHIGDAILASGYQSKTSTGRPKHKVVVRLLG